MGSGTSPRQPGWRPVIRRPRGNSTVAPTHSLGSVAMGIRPQPGSHWGEGLGGGPAGLEAQLQPPGKGLRLRKPGGGGGVWRRCPKPPPRLLLIVAFLVLWPAPSPPCSLARHTPYLGPGSWLMPRCPPGVLPSWGARHGHRRSGEATEVLAWPAGPGRAPRPASGLAGPLRCAPRGAPRWERISCPEPPTGEAMAVPR